MSLGRALTVDEAESAIGRVGRNDGPALLFDLVSSDRLDLETLRAILPGVWSGAEYPAVSLGTRFWVHLQAAGARVRSWWTPHCCEGFAR